MPTILPNGKICYALDEAIPLQPLRVSEGWCMAYNNALYDIDIDPECLDPEDYWHVFKEDMLTLTHARRNRLIDIGFYPEGNMESGEYGLVLHEKDHAGKLIAKLYTRDRAELVATIEDWMIKVTAGKI